MTKDELKRRRAEVKKYRADHAARNICRSCTQPCKVKRVNADGTVEYFRMCAKHLADDSARNSISMNTKPKPEHFRY